MVRKIKQGKMVDLLKISPEQQVEMVYQMFEMYYPTLLEDIGDCTSLEAIKETLTLIPKEILIGVMGEADMELARQNVESTYRKEGVKLALGFENGQQIFNYLKAVSWVRATRMLGGYQW